MKIKGVFLAAILTAVLCFSGNLLAYSGGTGEPNDPYKIANVTDFNQLSIDPNNWNKSFILTADINLTGLTFTQAPIATDTSTSEGFQGTQFSGVFDGNGHTISNLTISASTQDFIGLFGFVYFGGQIRNLGVEDVNMTGHYFVGGLVGSKDWGSTLTSCYVTGLVSGEYWVGGLVGVNRGTLTACYSTGSVSGTGIVGGLVGLNYYGTLTACYSTGSVSGTDGVGGLVGYNENSTLTSCYANGSVTETDSDQGRGFGVGGLVGSNGGMISNCYATGSVSEEGTGEYSYIGGLVGYNSSSLTACYATGSVSRTGTGQHSYIGGLVGYNTGSLATVSNCYATGSVSGTGQYDTVGGLVGMNQRLLISCYATGLVTGTSRVGGLVGTDFFHHSSTNCFWDIQTSGTSDGVGYIFPGPNSVAGKTTAEMMMLSTFTSAGWDFVGETANGTEDIWTICQGVHYPTFAWQNHPPTADAGPEQTVYAWIDGIAEVTLDGAGSNDPDCNELTYFWGWTIDGNDYEANGVNPTIELPIGVHTIQLVVNDGYADSAPDDVNVTVIAPLEGRLNIVPSTINRRSNQSHILAVIEIDNIAKSGINADELLTLYPGEIKAMKQWLFTSKDRHGKPQTTIFAFFDKDTLMAAVPTNGDKELKVAGKLKSGQYFYGRDTVRIIH